MHPPHPLALRHDAIAETYEDLKLLIYKVTHRYAVANRVPFQELLGEAHYSFVRAYDNYAPERYKKKAQFSSLVYFALSCDLKTYLKRQRKHTGLAELRDELCGLTDQNNFRVQLEAELEDDAKMVVQLLLDVPKELNDLLTWREVRNKRGFMRVLKMHLRKMDWSTDRIAIAFDEITRALTRY